VEPDKANEKEPQAQGAKPQQNTKTLGVVLTVIGGALIVWAYSRITSVLGKLHSWEPPFTQYETTTVAVAVIAIILLILGIRNLIKK
jgi:hypothetical protein